jgi:hypothetical protein
MVRNLESADVEAAEAGREPSQVETTIGVLAAAHSDRPASRGDLLRGVLADGAKVKRSVRHS